MAVTCLPCGLCDVRRGDRRRPPSTFTPTLHQLDNLIFLTSLTSLDFSNCIIPDHHFATIFAASSPLRVTLRRLSLRGSTILSIAIDWLLGAPQEYYEHTEICRRLQDRLSIAEFVDYVGGDVESIPALEAEYSNVDDLIKALNIDYALFKFVALSSSSTYPVTAGPIGFPRLNYLDLATIDCSNNQILEGVLSAESFPSLRHLVVLDKSLNLSESNIHSIQILQRSFTPSVQSNALEYM